MEELEPAPPRFQTDYVRPDPVPVDVPVVPPEPIEMSRRQRMVLWLGKKAFGAFGGVEMLEKLKHALFTNWRTTILMQVVAGLNLLANGTKPTEVLMSVFMSIVGMAMKDAGVTGTATTPKEG